MFSTQTPRVQPTTGERWRIAPRAPDDLVIMQKRVGLVVETHPSVHDREPSG